jgi:hypothetical protein
MGEEFYQLIKEVRAKMDEEEKVVTPEEEVVVEEEKTEDEAVDTTETEE